MHIDPYIVLGSAIVGLLVGMTGAGGGALMTPMLILLFGITPSTAISSDLVAAFVMRPIGAAVHLRAGTVNLSSGQVDGDRVGARGVPRRLHPAPDGRRQIRPDTHRAALGIALLVGAGGDGRALRAGSRQRAEAPWARRRRSSRDRC